MNTPTKITFSRIVATILMLITLFILTIIKRVNPDCLNIPTLGNSGINLLYLILCIFFIIAAATDSLDGYLARSRNQVTDLGKFLDPVADKLLVNSFIIFLCVPTALTDKNQYVWPVFSAIIIVARDIVVDCLRFVAAKKNVVIAANIFGKLKTIFQMVTIPLVLLNGWPFTYFDLGWNSSIRIVSFFIYLTTFVSLLSGTIYVIQNLKVFKND